MLMIHEVQVFGYISGMIISVEKRWEDIDHHIEVLRIV